MEKSIRSFEGKWWAVLDEKESSAQKEIKTTLAPFEESVKTVYECGTNVIFLKGENIHKEDIKLAALFLKRCLADFRVIWNLLNTGYASQAGTIIAGTFENALLVSAVAGDAKETKKLIKIMSKGNSWPIKELCKKLSRKNVSSKEGLTKREAEKKFELGWRASYGIYMWLCMLKHPTLPSLIHDAFSSSPDNDAYFLLTMPDTRKEDFALKTSVLYQVVTQVYTAICSFSEALNIDQNNPDFLYWNDRLKKAINVFVKLFFDINPSLPFPLIKYKIRQEYMEILESD
jgi:hypothetical protein